ncbi:hypothetical protein RvY_17067 [Ramazzottius varieornatus]|uniref:THAP-type domain-containing protein n=1 Tax=Ramazzottius varieornatus TaxID=947166 RepID=A0A1D1W1Q4_RAMVA|nr:hypothetical protein RvY_17067 [Ramazzottius varieornatus]
MDFARWSKVQSVRQTVQTAVFFPNIQQEHVECNPKVLVLFPDDSGGREDWLRRLNIAVKFSGQQSIGSDHFDSLWISGSRQGKMICGAVPLECDGLCQLKGEDRRGTQPLKSGDSEAVESSKGQESDRAIFEEDGEAIDSAMTDGAVLPVRNGDTPWAEVCTGKNEGVVESFKIGDRRK